MKQWNDIKVATNAQILAWAENQEWARQMALCQQDAQWHAEGDVWTHTKMVCAELERLDEWTAFDRHSQIKLWFAALFHDSGKPATTALDPETGRTCSPKHALAGAGIARRVLRQLECDLATREQIVALVRYHGRPPYLLEKKSPGHELICQIVYIEPPLSVLLNQNRNRSKPVPEKVVHELLEKLEPPTMTECYSMLLT